MWAFLRGEGRTPFAYAAAFALVGLAWLLSRLTPASAFPHVPLLIFGAAVLATGAIGGQAPALLSGCLSLLIADYFFLPAAGSFKLPYAAADAIGFGAFALVSALAAWVTGMTRRGAIERARADDLARKLAVENRHRQALLELGARSLAGGSVDAIFRDAVTMTPAHSKSNTA